VHVLVLSHGLTVNGSELVKGLTAGLRREVGVSGGLSADLERLGCSLNLTKLTPPSRSGKIPAFILPWRPEARTRRHLRRSFRRAPRQTVICSPHAVRSGHGGTLCQWLAVS
jgi:hypothetical protein